MIRGFIIFLCLLGSSFAAIPCSFAGLEHEIEFEPQSAALGTRNALELVDWFIKWRDGSGIADILISTQSTENDPHSLALSRERMRNISTILKQLNKNNVPMRLYDNDAVPARGPFSFLSNRAVVSIQPACIKTNSCCMQSRQP